MLGSGNGEPQTCAENLLKTPRFSVPYERIKGIDGKTAKVAPVDNIDNVSPAIHVAEWIKAESIVKESLVAYCLFPDNTGIILSKL